MSIYNADKLKYLINLRTGLKPVEIVCPRDYSDTTPCVCRDGRLAAIDDNGKLNEKCTGCGSSVAELLEKEEKMHRQPEFEEVVQGVGKWTKAQPDAGKIKFIDLVKTIYNTVIGKCED